jgi:4-amino-4-deoxy-L-arabinose transferase-like glycosyltransferase
MGRHDDRPAVVRTARPSVTPVAWCALVGVAARVLVAMAAADAGLFADMAQYDERARHLAATGTLWPDALRGPGYPALLAFAYTVFGPSLWTARVANALVGGALVVATGVLARAAGAGRHAWVASAIVAVYPALVLSSVYVMPEGLYALLIVATLVAVRHRTPAFAVAAGLAMGAAMLTRSVGVALAAAPLTLWLRAGRRGEASWRTALARLAMLAGACALVLAPWLAFTTRVAGGPLLDATSGVNLLLGNHPRATGRLVLGDEAELRGTYVAGAASTADGNARAIRAAVSWAFAHPGPWTQLAIAKLGYLFGLEGREHAWLYGHAYFGERRSTTVIVWAALLAASFPLLCLAAAVGVVRGPRPATPALIAIAAVVAATAALHVMSFGESRFHLPLVPLLAVVASLGLAERQPAERRGGRIAVVALILTALVIAWAQQWPELRDQLARLRAPNGWSSGPAY